MSRVIQTCCIPFKRHVMVELLTLSILCSKALWKTRHSDTNTKWQSYVVFRVLVFTSALSETLIKDCVFVEGNMVSLW